MEKFRSLIKGLKLPTRDDIVQAMGSFSKKERLFFIFLFLVLSISTLVLMNKVNNYFMEEVPASGGSLNEGIVGTPRFINPVLALSDADKDMTTLVYSGLMRKTENGELIPDLASTYTVSKDGLTYTFTLKDNIFFHDDKKVTADDIVYTINKIKDPTIKSPKRLNWEGVTVSRIDDVTVQFTLKQPYASFMDNTTIGILPVHLWNDVPAEQFSFIELNTSAVGSGPYKITKIKKDSSNIPEYYELSAFNKFVLGKPYIDTLTIKLYTNEKDLIDALTSGNIDQVSAIGQDKAEILKNKGYRVETATLPRIFALFLNQNQSIIFTDKKVTQAFELAIDKDEIVNSILHGYGKTIDSPVPKSLIDYTGLPYIAKNTQDGISDGSSTTTNNARNDAIESAKKILQDDGWKAGADGVLEKQTTINKKKENLRLEFSLSTGDASELKDIANLIKKDLELIGAKVEVKIFEIGSLNQDVIRPRKYDALLFGQIVNNGSDLFAFWHSSQRNDPGLNIASYTNTKVDKILEATLGNISKKDRIEKYTEFENEIKKDMPAIFIYSPDFIYIVAKNLNGLIINKTTNQSDRFNLIYQWYRQTDRVWKIFNR